MGVESANYSVSVTDGLARFDEVLLRLGGTRKQDESASSFDRWIVSGERHWIDVMRGKLGTGGEPAISVRVAVCNPPDVESVLRQVLATLLKEFSGQLRDGQTCRSYRALDDASWSEVQEAFAAKRAQFRQHFGDVEAAVSGDDVFEAVSGRGIPSEKST